MTERGPAPAGFVRRDSGWRAWIVFVALALAGATLAAAIWHEEHAVDDDCAVCQLRHQPVAEASASVHIGFADVPEPLAQVVDSGWIASGHFRRLPARAPPA